MKCFPILLYELSCFEFVWKMFGVRRLSQVHVPIRLLSTGGKDKRAERIMASYKISTELAAVIGTDQATRQDGLKGMC